MQRKPKRTKKAADKLNANYRLANQGTVILNDDNAPERRLVEQCFRTNKVILNPIVDWEEEDVWEFLNDVVKVPHCKLYDEGQTRIGCIGCPLAGCKSMRRDFIRWPKYHTLYLHAFERMIARHGVREAGHDDVWRTGEDVMAWWVDEKKRAPKHDKEKNENETNRSVSSVPEEPDNS